MKIVVWKSPKALCGLLRRLFGIREYPGVSRHRMSQNHNGRERMVLKWNWN